MMASEVKQYKQRCLFLVCGWTKQSKIDIPNEIIQLILTFYLLTIEHEMIFDKDVVDLRLFEIINEHKVKMIRGPSEEAHGLQWGVTTKLKYGISIDPNDNLDIKSISWKVKHTVMDSFPNSYYFIGVVSNRTKEFATNPFWSGVGKDLLKDAFGISGNKSENFQGRNRPNDDELYDGYKRDTWITIKYIINDSKLIFEYKNQDDKDSKFEMMLPKDIKDITHWYPAICLRDAGDECEIADIIVE